MPIRGKSGKEKIQTCYVVCVLTVFIKSKVKSWQFNLTARELLDNIKDVGTFFILVLVSSAEFHKHQHS